VNKGSTIIIISSSLNPYNHHINTINLKTGSYQLTPLREQDIFDIKNWRNAQMDVLRQNHELTDEEQLRYFHEVIKPTFTEQFPQQMLSSFLLNERCIGYGGLTNIDWQAMRAELSFLLNPKRVADEAVYEKDFSIFLTLIKRLAFEGLKLNRIFTETYNIRPLHIAVLEKNGFVPEGRMLQHVFVGKQFVDLVLHGFLKEQYVAR
jgi:RimJ/RimL family protein N-acetyltransferase